MRSAPSGRNGVLRVARSGKIVEAGGVFPPGAAHPGWPFDHGAPSSSSAMRYSKKGSGTVAGTARRVLRTTEPDPFFSGHRTPLRTDGDRPPRVRLASTHGSQPEAQAGRRALKGRGSRVADDDARTEVGQWRRRDREPLPERPAASGVERPRGCSAQRRLCAIAGGVVRPAPSVTGPGG